MRDVALCDLLERKRDIVRFSAMGEVYHPSDVTQIEVFIHYFTFQKP